MRETVVEKDNVCTVYIALGGDSFKGHRILAGFGGSGSANFGKFPPRSFVIPIFYGKRAKFHRPEFAANRSHYCPA